MQEQELKSIQLLATKIRRDVMQMLLPLGSGHLGG